MDSARSGLPIGGEMGKSRMEMRLGLCFCEAPDEAREWLDWKMERGEAFVNLLLARDRVGDFASVDDVS